MEKSLNEDTYEKLKYDIMNFKLVPGDSISAQKIAVRQERQLLILKRRGFSK